jgi:hypothetical protein
LDYPLHGPVESKEEVSSIREVNSMNNSAKKSFTVSEANAMLPLVRAIVDDIVRLHNEIKERRDRLSQIRQVPGHRRGDDNPYDEEVQQIEDELEKDDLRLTGFVDELRRLGVELKDHAVGLVDFPTQIDGRDAYLCWKLGEGEIAFWHSLDGGFSGRQSLLASSLPGDPPSQPGKGS